MTLNEAVEKFACTMNKIHKDLIFRKDIEVNNVTMPKTGDSVTIVLSNSLKHGYVVSVSADAGSLLYTVRINEDHDTVTIPYEDNIFLEEEPDVLYNFLYGMPGYLGDDWLCSPMNRKMASDLGFLVYLTDYGYFLGIGAFGFDFKEAYWKPFYLMLDLGWHKQDNGMKLKEILERKINKKKKMLGDIEKEIYDKSYECLMQDNISHKRWLKLQSEINGLKQQCGKLEAQIAMYEVEVTPVFKNLFL